MAPSASDQKGTGNFARVRRMIEASIEVTGLEPSLNVLPRDAEFPFREKNSMMSDILHNTFLFLSEYWCRILLSAVGLSSLDNGAFVIMGSTFTR